MENENQVSNPLRTVTVNGRSFIIYGNNGSKKNGDNTQLRVAPAEMAVSARIEVGMEMLKSSFDKWWVEKELRGPHKEYIDSRME